MAEIPVNENDAIVTVEATVAGQTDFDFDFLVYEGSQVAGIFKDVSAGTETDLTFNEDFTVSGLEQATGGTLSLISLGASVEVGDMVVVYRNTPIERLTDFVQSGDFRAEDVNREEDMQVMMMQELSRDVSRSVKTPLGEPGVVIVPGADGSVPVWQGGDLKETISADDITNAQAYAQTAEEHKDAAEAAAANAAAASGNLFFKSVAEMVDDTAMEYTLTTGVLVTEGNLVHTGATRFTVADSAVTDQHYTTAGGVKLYEYGPVFSSEARLISAITRGYFEPAGTTIQVGDKEFQSHLMGTTYRFIEVSREAEHEPRHGDISFSDHKPIAPFTAIANISRDHRRSPGPVDLDTIMSAAVLRGNADTLADGTADVDFGVDLGRTPVVFIQHRGANPNITYSIPITGGITQTGFNCKASDAAVYNFDWVAF